MLIEKMVDFCHGEYQKHSCTNCTGCVLNDNSCNGDCSTCLDDIHFHYNKKRKDYNCEHLLDYYVCRYSYKYCSELLYALNLIDFTEYPYFHILSLGCGGAPDLMAFDYIGYSQKIQYVGIDNNPYWLKVHQEIQNQFPKGNVTFWNDVDVLSYFKEKRIPECNILIIEYLISFFYKEIRSFGVRKWFKELANNIVSLKPKDSPLLIIINDVDSINTGRDTFGIFKDEICSLGFNVQERRMRFKEVEYFKGSTQYPEKKNKFSVPEDIVSQYKVALNCESVQLILEVK